MTLSALIVQLLTPGPGLVAVPGVGGLSLIFGVTRIVNFAHGSFFMLGVYIAYSLVDQLGPRLGFWPALLLAAPAVACWARRWRCCCCAASTARLSFPVAGHLCPGAGDQGRRRCGGGALRTCWGPRAPGLGGSVEILGRRFPTYDLLLIAVGPLVLAGLTLLLTRTRWGTLVRAATQDREMVGALGVNQAWLFTSVFALGAMLAGLGGALQLPREPASLNLDLLTVGDAFVVVVVGGLGSIPGAFVAALIIARSRPCAWAWARWTGSAVSFSFSKLTLVVEFLVMRWCWCCGPGA